MTQQETNKILVMMVEVYPKFNEGRNPQVTSKLWSTLFADEPYELVEKAFLAFVATDVKGFPPSPGAIKEQIALLQEANEKTELEAWGQVLKAIRRSAYNSREEFAKLPADVREIVGTPEQLYEWAMMDADEVHTVIASNFQRSYRARAESRRKFGRLPSSLRVALPKNESTSLPETQTVAIEAPEYEYSPMPQSFRDVAMKLGLVAKADD